MCDGPLGKEGRGRLLRPLGKVPTLQSRGPTLALRPLADP